MTVAASDSAVRRHGRSLTGLKVAAACLIGLKLLYTVFAFPIADEAYYWLWGRRLELSYFDHPGLQAWVQGLSHLLLGTSLLALRLPTLLVLAATIWVLRSIARRIGGADWERLFWTTLVVYLASPLFGLFGSVAFNDYLLVALCLGSGYFFLSYFAAVETEGEGKPADLLIAAVLLGLAGLTKYNAVFLGLGVLATVLLRPRLRGLLFRWPIWVAAAIAVGLQAPTVIWNAGNDMASFQFHLMDRHGEDWLARPKWGLLRTSTIDSIAFISPLLIPMVVSLFLRPARPGYESLGKTLAIAVFWASSGFFLVLATFDSILIWWNVVGLVMTMPFLGRHAGRVLLWLHVVYGGLLSAFLATALTILPVNMLFGGPPVMESNWAYGWDQVARAVEQAKAEHRADFVATGSYQRASQLAFALDDPGVTALAERRDQFDFWFDAAGHAGQSAVVLVETARGADYVARHFEVLTELETLDIRRFGRRMTRYTLYLGEGFRPAAADAASASQAP